MCKINFPEGATLDEKRSICFDALYEMNLGDKVEKKDGLSYLTWSEAITVKGGSSPFLIN